MVIQERCCVNIGPQYEKFVTSNLETYEQCNVSCSVRPEIEQEVRTHINNITDLLTTEFSLKEENIEISKYSGKSPFYSQTINGIRYELDDPNSGIVGELFVIFSRDAQPYYIFRTEIAYEPEHSVMTELIKELGLTMNMQDFLTRESAYRQPIFYKKYDRFETQTFVEFLGNIAFIAEAYPLQMPRKQYAEEPTTPIW